MILSNDDPGRMEPDVDLKLDKAEKNSILSFSSFRNLYYFLIPECVFIILIIVFSGQVFPEEYQRKLFWREFYSSPVTETYSESSRSRVSETLNNPERGIHADFIEAQEDPELALCYGIFGNDNFSQDESKKDSKPSFECDICAKQFSKQYNLKEHKRIHTGNKLLCSVVGCNTTFNDKSSLNKHTKTVHKAHKPYSCDNCDKAFSRSSHLQDHRAVHTKEKKFQCSICQKRFSFLSTKKSHELIHTERQDFKCDHCLKPFKGKQTLKVHLLNVHKIREFILG